MRQYAQEIGDRFVAALAHSYGDAYTFLRCRSNVARWSPEHIVVLRDRVEHAYQEGRISAETLDKACKLIASLVGDYDDPKTDEIALARPSVTAQGRSLAANAKRAESPSSAQATVRHPPLTAHATARDTALDTVVVSEFASTAPSSAPAPLTALSAPAPLTASNVTMPRTVPSSRVVIASPSKIVAGATLAQRYVLEKLVGIGGTALIYQARDLKATGAQAEQRVAVKLLHPVLQTRPAAVERFVHQFRQQQKLSHPGIARVFDLDVDAGNWFMTMELLAGETLLDRSRQSVSRSEALRLIAACGEALGYAHECGVVHGDLKPSNIFLTQSGALRLLDFGGTLAQRSSGAVASDVSSIAATPAYASPEVLAGERPVVRDDVFSLACIAHELLTGQHRHAHDAGKTQPRPTSAALTLRDSLALSRGMAWQRLDRPETVAEFLSLLLASQPTISVPALVSGPADTAAATLRTRWQRHGRLLGFGLWGVGCLLALLSFVFGDPEAIRQVQAPSTAVAAPRTEAPAVVAPTEITSTAVTPSAVGPVAAGPSAIVPSTVSPSAVSPSPVTSSPVTPTTPPGASAPQPEAPATDASPITPVPKRPAIAAPRPLSTKTAPNADRARRAAAVRVLPASTPVVASAAGSIGLEKRQVLVSGRAVAAVITLKRIGSTSGRVRVRWSTVSGTAKSAQDYRAASAIAEFADGQEIRTLFVPIMQQRSERSARTFSIALERAPGGPPVGPVTRTAVTILGDT